MKTGYFKTKYRTPEGEFTCTWFMLFDKCFFVRHEKQTEISADKETRGR